MQSPCFNRADIIMAHNVLEVDYNVSGVLQERESNQRRCMSTSFQINRIEKRAPRLRGLFFIMAWRYRDLSPNGKAIYRELERRYGFKKARK